MDSAVFDTLISLALEEGAHKAAVVAIGDVPTDPELRKFCEQNVCHSYGKNWACPPDVGTAEEVIRDLYGFSHLLVFQYIGQLEDSFDLEGMGEAAETHRDLMTRFREVADRIELPRRLYLGAGGCRICPVCARVTDEPCRFPEKRMASLESYCINVSGLAKAAGMKYVNGENTVTYFGGMLFDVN